MSHSAGSARSGPVPEPGGARRLAVERAVRPLRARPLDRLRSIKVKLGIVIVAAVFTTLVVNEVGLALNFALGPRVAVAVVLSLTMVQLLARGMTSPLRDMASAARAMARGDYSRRIYANSGDEVGELARAFNTMAADLAQVDRQRRDLIANTSHELRTPITALQAVLENLVDGIEPPEPARLEAALAQTQRLSRLVAQLLDLSRLESGVTRLDREQVDLRGFIDQAVREAALPDRDVRLSTDVPRGLAITADPARLNQVLANLLDNATRHSPPGGEVAVTAARNGGGVRITVTDQGPGIPAADRARVFERFSRLDGGRDTRAGGSGLGLAIAREVVELHGGSLYAEESARGGGCRMVVDLLEVTVRGSGARRPEPAPPRGGRAHPSGG